MPRPVWAFYKKGEKGRPLGRIYSQSLTYLKLNLALQFKNHAFIQEPYSVKNEAGALCKVGANFRKFFLCRPSGNHPYEDLAKSGDKTDMKF